MLPPVFHLFTQHWLTPSEAASPITPAQTRRWPVYLALPLQLQQATLSKPPLVPMGSILHGGLPYVGFLAKALHKQMD